MRPQELTLEVEQVPREAMVLPPGANLEPDPQTAIDVASSEKTHGVQKN